MTSAKIKGKKAIEFFLHFLKLHKVLSICAKFQVYSILQSEIKYKQIRGQNITVEIGLKERKTKVAIYDK